MLALHPGTKAALDRAGVTLRGDVQVVAPQGYRTTLALQLHAAAVLTDSSGLQREAAWLRTPCLIQRDRTAGLDLRSAGAAEAISRIRAEASVR